MVSQVRILGPIEVELRDEVCARIPRGRTLALLALLLVHRGAIVALDRIADELWDGDGPQNPRNAVQVIASRLRAAVGEDLVVSGARGYALRPPAGALHAQRFEGGRASAVRPPAGALAAERWEAEPRRGAELLARAEPEEAAASLRDALAL